MQARLDPRKASPEAMKAIGDLHAYIRDCGLEHGLLELVKLRASQINGCAWCMDMHTKELRAAGENEQRIYLLSAWRECPFYSDRERAALAWTEALTFLRSCARSSGLKTPISSWCWENAGLMPWRRKSISIGGATLFRPKKPISHSMKVRGDGAKPNMA